MLVKMPVGKGFEECEVRDEMIKAFLEPSWPSMSGCQLHHVLNALGNPIGSESLNELAVGKKNVLVLTSDNTRPVPSQETLPAMIKAIRNGSPEASLRLLIATGLHDWSPSRDELEGKYGSCLDQFEDVTIHRAADTGSLTLIGSLSRGNRLYVNRLITESDLVVADGYIEGHFFAGFTGGPKVVLPGISGAETIMRNHSPSNIDHQMSRCGVAEGNPIYEEMCEASRMANLRFVVNVVLGEKKRIISAFAGDPLAAHREGRDFALRCCKVSAMPAEIVVTSNGGYPLDRNLYQLVKGISNGALTAKNGGVIVACGECTDGVGPKGFYDMLASSESPSEFLRALRAGKIWREAQWEAQILAKTLERCKVVIVSRGVDARTVESMHMIHAGNLTEGLEEAFNVKPEGGVTLLPDGPSVIPF